jgi:hypothetical protein
MFLRITNDPHRQVTLQEPDDFKRLHVEVVALDSSEFRTVVERQQLGRLAEDDHLELRVGALISLAPTRTADWDDGLSSMLRYAQSKGWMTDDDHVRAHCEFR